MSGEPTLSEGLATTRTIRRYTDDPISDDQLAKVLHLATRAPSGSNRQPFRFVVLRDGPTAMVVRRLLHDGAQQIWAEKRARREFDPSSTQSASTSQAGREPTATERMLRSMDAYVERLADAPVIVLPCMVRYRDPTPTEGASVYPAVQNLLLGARSIGLGAAVTMFHRVRESEIEDALGLPADAFIAATITMGVPAGSHGPVRRRPLGELVFEDHWDESPPWAVDPPGTRFTGGPRR